MGDSPVTGAKVRVSFESFVGQRAVIQNLEIMLEHARNTGERLPHMLFTGPPGLGKTTLANLLGQEFGLTEVVNQGKIGLMTIGMGALIEDEHPIMFADEIQTVSKQEQEYLLPMLSKPTGFCFIAATTAAGRLIQPLRDRFDAIFRFLPYEVSELAVIAQRHCLDMGLQVEGSVLLSLAQRSRGNPRQVKHLAYRMSQFGMVIGPKEAQQAFSVMQVDKYGLGPDEHAYLKAILDLGGGPTGLANIAMSLRTEEEELKEVTEPDLVRLGFISLTPRGRKITDRGLAHIAQVTRGLAW